MSNTVTSVAQTTTQNTTATQRTTSQELGKDEFLQILAMQLSNQDPLEPMSDTDFIAQMAQFSSLEQMQALNSAFSSYQTYSLMGKNVLATVSDEAGGTAQIYGEVTGIVRENDTDYLQIGEYLVPQSAVSAIYDDDAMDAVIAQAANLVGKQIEAEVPAGEGQDGTETISGTVSAVLVKNGLLYAAVEDKEVPVAYINKIS
jgi:flagellar basal-body rod modification protein FlgD